MAFPSFESLAATVEPARQVTQLASLIRDRTVQLGIEIDSGAATAASFSRWLDDVARAAAPIAGILAIPDMQATLRTMTGDGKLSIADESKAMMAAVDMARNTARTMVKFLAPTFDEETGRIRLDRPLADVVPKDVLAELRVAIDGLAAAITS
jgi:hypothetical protein